MDVTDEPLISVAVLTHNRKDIVLKNLERLLSLNYTNYEIILTDNGSTDGTYKAVNARFSNIKIVRNSQNAGVAGGRNTGLRYSKGEYVLLLDDDVFVDENILRDLVEVLQKNPDVGAVAPKINHTGKQSPHSRWSFFFYVLVHQIWGIRPCHPKRLDATLLEMPTLDGCCLMIKREVLERVPLLDERFFIHYEDTDFTMRIRRAGYKLLRVLKAKAWHKDHYQTTIKRTYYLIRNIVLLTAKNASRWRFLVFLFSILPICILYYLLIGMKYVGADVLRAAFSAISSAFRELNQIRIVNEL